MSKILQNKSANISLASNQLQKCVVFIEKFRDSGLNDSISKAKEIAAECDIDPVFEQKRPRKKKKLFSYESGDDYNPTPEDIFKRDVFFPLIDTMLVSLRNKGWINFQIISQIVDFCMTLNIYREKKFLKIIAKI